MPVVGSAQPYRPDSWTGNENERGEVTYDTVWKVQVDDPQDGPVTVFGATGLPAINDAYSVGNDTNNNAWVVSRTVRGRADEHSLLWLVDVQYSSVTDTPKDEATGQPSNDPASWRTERRIHFLNRQLPFVKGQFVSNSNGKPVPPGLWHGGLANVETTILNSAGEPVERPPMVDDQRMVVTSSRYILNPDTEQLKRYRNAVNTDNFTIAHLGIGSPVVNVWTLNIAAGTAKIMGIVVDEEEINSQIWPKVTVTIAIDEDGWLIDVPDVGRMARACPDDDPNWEEGADPNGLGGTQTSGVVGRARVQNIFDPVGNVVTGPVQLDGEGFPIGCGDEKNTMRWRNYPELPFAGLLL